MKKNWPAAAQNAASWPSWLVFPERAGDELQVVALHSSVPRPCRQAAVYFLAALSAFLSVFFASAFSGLEDALSLAPSALDSEGAAPLRP